MWTDHSNHLSKFEEDTFFGSGDIIKCTSICIFICRDTVFGCGRQVAVRRDHCVICVVFYHTQLFLLLSRGHVKNTADYFNRRTKYFNRDREKQ